MSEVLEKKKALFKTMQQGMPGLSADWSQYRWVARKLDCPGCVSWEALAGRKSNDDVVRAVLEKYGELLGPPDVLGGRCVTSGAMDIRDGRGNKGLHIHAYQAETGVPVYGATLLLLADSRQGLYRILSGFWHEVRITSRAQAVDEQGLRGKLLDRLEQWKKTVGDSAAGLLDGLGDLPAEDFPLLTPPVLYLHWNEEEKEFHPAYHVRAIQPRKWKAKDGQRKSDIGGVMLMVDAVTGEVLWEAPTLDAASPTVSMKGPSALAGADGHNIERPLLVTARGDSFRMVNRTHAIPIITYTARGKSCIVDRASAFNKATEICEAARDCGFSRTSRSMKPAARAASQQPEVDAHYYAEAAYNYYETLGWSGFDDGRFCCPVQIVVHTGLRDDDSWNFFQAYTSTVKQGEEAQQRREKKAVRHFGYIAFCDGLVIDREIFHEYYASDPVIFAHEYQHAISHFAVVKAETLEPGHLDQDEDGWFGAIKEGLSDAFAGLRTGFWTIPTFFPQGAIRYGLPYRRIDFPRSPATFGVNCDHFDDVEQDLLAEDLPYYHSSILSHLAFLLGEGGVHQRTKRKASLIPVTSIGRHRTAEIFMRALPSFNKMAGKDKWKVFLKAADYLLSAAKDVSGDAASIESVMMRRALYAMGLHPFSDYAFKKQTYGGEACMLPWTHAWRLSQPYLGYPDKRWGSPDLYICNGKGACNAEIGGDNFIFARVRNIGDEALRDVEVRFFYSPIGTNIPEDGWRPCKDSNGRNCILKISSLAEGSVSPPDLECPHSIGKVPWTPEEGSLTDGVRHFGLRADLLCEAANHQNDVKYRVQSSIIVVESSIGEEIPIVFYITGKPVGEEDQLTGSAARVRLEWAHTLPEGYNVEFDGEDPSSLSDISLQAGESRLVRFKLRCPEKTGKEIREPFEGRVEARLKEPIDGQFLGELSGVHTETVSHGATQEKNTRPVSVTGLLSGHVWKDGEKMAHLQGGFEGKVDTRDGSLNGILTCAPRDGEKIALNGEIEPFRAIHFTQYIDDVAVGGITVIVTEPEQANVKSH